MNTTIAFAVEISELLFHVKQLQLQYNNADVHYHVNKFLGFFFAMNFNVLNLANFKLHSQAIKSTTIKMFFF